MYLGGGMENSFLHVDQIIIQFCYFPRFHCCLIHTRTYAMFAVDLALVILLQILHCSGRGDELMALFTVSYNYIHLPQTKNLHSGM